MHHFLTLCVRFGRVRSGSDEVDEPKPVRLDRIAPDLAMVHLDRHKIKWEDLQKEEGKPMGEGGFAAVYRGTYLGEPVAIKELKSADVEGFATLGINVDAESRRLTFEEFRHEVWIMRCDTHTHDTHRTHARTQSH